MPKNTSITLGDHFEEIVRNSIASGRYSSVSEVIRAGLRLIDEQEQHIRLMRDAIEAGQESGYIKNFDPAKNLAALNAQAKE